MKKLTLVLVAILWSFFASAQYCLPGTILGPSSVVVGHSISLYDTTGVINYGPGSSVTATGTWISSNPAVATVNSATGQVRGLSSGTATITFQPISPCASVVASRVINVYSGNRGRFRMCPGDTVTMHSSDTIAVMSWSSSNTSVATINDTTGFVTAIDTGKTVISCIKMVAGVSYTASDTLKVAVITSVGTHISPIALCSGVVSDTILPSAHTPLLWSFSDSSVIHTYWTYVDTLGFRFVGTSAGHTYLRYRSEYCLSIKDSVDITVNPLPDPGYISGILGYVCAGTSQTATIVGSDGIPGIWSVSNWYPGAITVTPTSSTTALVRDSIPYTYSQLYYAETNIFGCSAYTSADIYVDGPPFAYGITGAIAIPIGDTIHYSGTWTGSANWFLSSPSIATLSGITIPTCNVTGMLLGTVHLYHHFSNSCGVNSETKSIDIIPPAIGGICPGFSAFVHKNCSNPQFGVSVPSHAVGYSLVTSFGDGSFITTAIPANASTAITTFNHYYSMSGLYTIKQVLYNAGVSLDSVEYNYQQLLCKDIAISFYQDNNTNCAFDSGAEHLNYAGLQIAVDSNGTRVDTIPATSGLYYHTMAMSGDVYSFSLINSSAALHISCPSSGIFSDTITAAGTGFAHIYMGLDCNTSSVFDLYPTPALQAGRHAAMGGMFAANASCYATSGMLTIALPSGFYLYSSVPAPTSVSSTTATWDFTSLSTSNFAPYISFHLELTSPSWLYPGDTLHSEYSTTPFTGDVVPSNNTKIRVDTVKSSYDPNHISVTPAGNILNDTKLHYAIQFENDGNDTAHNIFVLDTLSDALIPSSLRIEGASAVMNTTVLHWSGHTILKFEFPHIMLPDSAHQDVCRGMFAYSIMVKTGLVDGTDILGHVGIYFDDNEVVLTDTAFNKIVVPHVTVAISGSDSVCDGIPVHFMATPYSLNMPHYHWYVNSLTAGTDSAGFVLPFAHVGDTIKCVMTTIAGDTVYSVSNLVILHSGGEPWPGVISGFTSVCVGSNISLAETTTGGIWSVTNSHASITSAGVVHGLNAGIDTVLYSKTNICGVRSAVYAVTINPLPNAGTISGSSTVCIGTPVTLSSTVGGGTWYHFGSHVSNSGSVYSGAAAGTDSAIYAFTNMCGTATTRYGLHVDAYVTPSITMSSSPGLSVCEGDTVTFIPAPVNGGSAPVYHWKRFGSIISTGSALAYVPSLSDVVTCTMLSSALCPNQDSVTTSGAAMTVYPLVTPNNVIVTTDNDTVTTPGQAVTFNSTTTFCGAATGYQWFVNGVAVPGATSSSCTITINENDDVYSVINCSIPCATSATDTSNLIRITYINTDDINQLNGSGISDLQLIPNPNTGIFTMSGYVGPKVTTVRYDVLDITGKLFSNGNATLVDGYLNEQIAMPLNTASGSYILRVVSQNGVTYVKFIVEK